MAELIAKILGDWIITKILDRLPAPLRGFVVVAAFGALILSAIYLAWTTWTVSRIVRKSLGRNPRLGEDTSISAWMRASSESLEAANRELGKPGRSTRFPASHCSGVQERTLDPGRTKNQGPGTKALGPNPL